MSITIWTAISLIAAPWLLIGAREIRDLLRPVPAATNTDEGETR